jgi:hypothetical protein
MIAEEITMIPFDEGEQERLTFLYEIYKQSAGDARQGIPYEVLIEALGFDERVIKRIQRELQRDGLVELTAVPQMTTMCRPVIDHVHRQHHQQTIALTQQGVHLLEDVIATRHTGPLDHTTV